MEEDEQQGQQVEEGGRKRMRQQESIEYARRMRQLGERKRACP